MTRHAWNGVLGAGLAALLLPACTGRQLMRDDRPQPLPPPYPTPYQAVTVPAAPDPKTASAALAAPAGWNDPPARTASDAPAGRGQAAAVVPTHYQPRPAVAEPPPPGARPAALADVELPPP